VNSNSMVRRAVAAVATALVVAGVVTAGMWLGGRERASAAEIKTRCLRALRVGRSWKARVTETETGSDGTESVMKRDVVVHGPDAYRVTMTERDERGRDVVSTTLRVGTTLYMRRVEPDGSVVLRVTSGVPPELGVMMDNVVGEMVSSVVDSARLRQVRRENVRGRPAYKLETAPEHYVWVDESIGLPLKEQILSDGKVNHEVDVDSIDINATIASGELGAASLGPASRTETEDLGFRPTDGPPAARRHVGFCPLVVPLPTGFSAGVQGYIDPQAAVGGGSYIASFERGTEGVLVTQMRRDGLDGAVGIASDERETGGPGQLQVSVDGRPAVFFPDTTAPRLQFAVGDVLLTIEGPLSMQDMLALAEKVH